METEENQKVKKIINLSGLSIVTGVYLVLSIIFFFVYSYNPTIIAKNILSACLIQFFLILSIWIKNYQLSKEDGKSFISKYNFFPYWLRIFVFIIFLFILKDIVMNRFAFQASFIFCGKYFVEGTIIFLVFVSSLFYLLSSFSWESYGLKNWKTLRLTLIFNQWFSLVTGLILLVVKFSKYDYAFYLDKVITFFLLFLSLEISVKAASVLLFITDEGEEENIILLSTFFSSFNPLTSFLIFLEKYFYTDIRNNKTIKIIKDASYKTFLSIILLLFLSTALFMVNVGDQAVIERNGRILKNVFEPGLHLKFPYPMDKKREFNSYKINEMTIGFKSGKKKVEDFIWTKGHGREEYFFVVGSGRELISIDAILVYKVKDIKKYGYQFSNPLEALETYAYRAVLKETIYHNINQLLSKDRNILSTQISKNIQKNMDKLATGIEVIDFQIRAIHPPLQVADAFQRVTSSNLEKNTLIIKSRAESERILSEARAIAKNKIITAESESLLKYKRAIGAVYRFKSLAKEYEKNPIDYKDRVLLDTKKNVLKEKRIIVVDDTIYKGDVENWIKVNQ